MGNDMEYHGGKDYVLDDEDCPLSILMNHPPSKGESCYFQKVPEHFSVILFSPTQHHPKAVKSYRNLNLNRIDDGR